MDDNYVLRPEFYRVHLGQCFILLPRSTVIDDAT